MKNIDEYLKRATMRLKEIREASGLKQKDFALMFNVDISSFNRYETGDIKMMPKDLIENICKKYGINPAWLSGFENVSKYQYETIDIPSKPLPILKEFEKGVPILTEKYIEGFEFVPKDFNADYCLRIQDDSMINARIMKGDLVFICRQSDIHSGEIGIVMINETETVLKKVYKFDGSLVLRSENPKIPEMTYDKKEAEKIKIIGKAVCFKSEV